MQLKNLFFQKILKIENINSFTDCLKQIFIYFFESFSESYNKTPDSLEDIKKALSNNESIQNIINKILLWDCKESSIPEILKKIKKLLELNLDNNTSNI